MGHIGRLSHLVLPLNLVPILNLIIARSLNNLRSIDRSGWRCPSSCLTKDRMMKVGRYKPLVNIFDEIVSGLSGPNSCRIRAAHFIYQNKINSSTFINHYYCLSYTIISYYFMSLFTKWQITYFLYYYYYSLNNNELWVKVRVKGFNWKFHIKLNGTGMKDHYRIEVTESTNGREEFKRTARATAAFSIKTKPSPPRSHSPKHTSKTHKPTNSNKNYLKNHNTSKNSYPQSSSYSNSTR